MKTSNKILLGLAAVVFTVPLLLAAALQSKIKKGDYTVEKYDNTEPESMASGSFTAFKVIKVIAPDPQLLTCHLKVTDKMEYSYNKGDRKDSIRVFTGNDTLYIMYVARQKKANKNERSNQGDFEINVNLPAFNNMVVDGAEVILDSLGASSGTLSVTLKNKGVIKDGSENRAENGSKESPAAVIKKGQIVPVSEMSKAKGTRDSDIGNKKIRNESLVTSDIREYVIYQFL